MWTGRFHFLENWLKTSQLHPSRPELDDIRDRGTDLVKRSRVPPIGVERSVGEPCKLLKVTRQRNDRKIHRWQTPTSAKTLQIASKMMKKMRR